jgi:hypothetical protein
VIFTALIAVVVMLSTSCGSGGGSESGDPIVGTWTIVKAEGTASSSNEGTKYAFSDDGKVKVGEGLMASECTYTCEGEKLNIEFPGGIVMKWIYKIEGDEKMTMENATDATQKFWLEKE